MRFPPNETPMMPFPKERPVKQRGIAYIVTIKERATYRCVIRAETAAEASRQAEQLLKRDRAIILRMNKELAVTVHDCRVEALLRL